MIDRGDMLSTVDIIEVLAIDLIGIVPDDEEIIVSTNRGVPVSFENNSNSGMAFRNIARRLEGDDVPFMTLKDSGSFFKRLVKFMRQT
jgi:septum site-determining protein MinD